MIRNGGRLALDIFTRASRHHTLLLASGVAFTSALALVPAMIAIVALYGLIASPADVQANLAGLADVLPDAAAELVITELQELTTSSRTRVTIGLIVGLAGAAWAISTAVNSVVIAIRVAHEVPSPHNWVQGRWFALKLSLAAVLAMLTSVWLIVVLPAAAPLDGHIDTIARLVRWPIVVAVSAWAVALLYRIVPHRRRGVGGMTAGTAAATAMWVLSTYGLSLVYQQIDRLQSTFTTLSAVAALLIWFYLAAVSVLLGAELDAALDAQALGRATEGSVTTPAED